MGRKWEILLLGVIAFCAFFVFNGEQSANIMEARNFTTAREIVQEGNWLMPTMNGELRLEKPPLPTWVAAITMHIFGIYNLSALRFATGIMGVLIMVFLYLLVAQMTKDRWLPFYSAATVATSFYVYFLARTGTWDIYCHAFMLGAIGLLYRMWSNNRSSMTGYSMAGVLMGLSFLSKGPVAFFALLLPFLVAYFICFNREIPLKQWRGIIVMISIVLVISLWWPLYIYMAHPEALEEVTNKEAGAWLNRHVRPWYHYWSFPVQSGVWALVAFLVIVFPYAGKRIKQLIHYRFILLWILISVFLLSLMPEKKERYLMPVLIPLAILIAGYFRYLVIAFKEVSYPKVDRHIFRALTVILGVVCLAVPFIVLIKDRDLNQFSFLVELMVFIVFWMFAGGFVYALKNTNVSITWGLIVAMVCAVNILVLPGIQEGYITNNEYHPIEELRGAEILENKPVYFHNDSVRIEVVWELGKKIKMHEFDKDLSPLKDLPIVMLSNEDPEDFLPDSILETIHIEKIGRFDNNMNNRRRNKLFENTVSVIKKR
ncbi:phospholipid carrier-dependent glycosyltransferase [Puteibacter caeruleilacunae]|nr:phospholipid carrier-dependent glycosyltransferase [Puteibacter caeruleilacunae]